MLLNGEKKIYWGEERCSVSSSSFYVRSPRELHLFFFIFFILCISNCASGVGWLQQRPNSPVNHNSVTVHVNVSSPTTNIINLIHVRISCNIHEPSSNYLYSRKKKFDLLMHFLLVLRWNERECFSSFSFNSFKLLNDILACSYNNICWC